MTNFFIKIKKNIYIPENAFTVINRYLKGLKNVVKVLSYIKMNIL